MTVETSDEEWMRRALHLARLAEADGEVPVGAVVVRQGEVLGEGQNSVIQTSDTSAHAEINAIRAAGVAAGNYRLPGATLYVTLEPCAMCAGAMVHARIERVVYGATDPRSGAAGSLLNILEIAELNHRCLVTRGVLQEECARILSDFFLARR